ncbi:MAG: LPS export ABC transporter permease LptG [Gammaproteobacteria bacterium]|nr:LPS export ABC transporter permease LptG [Gammaproteobacteria bacterium]
MKLFDRYLGRAVIAGSGLALAILVAVNGFVDLIDEIQDVGEHGYTIWLALFHTVLEMPQRAYEFFPTAVLLGGLLGLGNLAASNELVALRAAGISIARLIGSVLATGLLLMALAVFIGEVIAPASQERAQDLKKWAQGGSITLGDTNELWAKDGNRFINIKQIFPGLRLNDVRVYLIDDAQRLVQATFATAAVYRDGQWRMSDVSRSTISDARIVTERSPRESWRRLLSPELFSVIEQKPEHMPAWRLARYIDYLRDNHLAAESYELAFWTRFTTPLSSLVMLLLAIPFVFGSLRTGGAGQRLFIGLLIGIAFHLINRALNHLALVYGLDPLQGATLPLLAFFVIGLIAVARTR